MIKLIGSAAMVLLGAALGEAAARGVTPYLPLNLDPQIEHQVERVLILADKPVMRRPIPAAVVLDALPKACQVDELLCEHVRVFLSNYMNVSGVTFASYEVATASGSGDKAVLPNQHGARADSNYRAAAAGYLQPNDFLLLSVGAAADEGRAVATGSMLSAGFDFAQLDIGFRDHWWSPMTDSAVLISSEAPTMPSITLSNYRPLTRLGWQYEWFVARMSHSNDIELTNGALTSGYPKFGGLHLSIEPVSGWSLGAQRIIVWGGGAAGGQSFKSLLKAFFNPSKAQSTGFGTLSKYVIGKQEGSVSSRFIFPGEIPFAVYFEYAGNDTVQGHNYLLGKPDLSGGVHVPHLGPFDLTLEASQWEPTWYVHHHSDVQTGYGDGITNYRLSIGHWFGDQRLFGDAVGGRSNMVRIGWEPPFGGRLEAEYRMLVNDSFYSAMAYRHENLGAISYAHPWREYAVGAEVDVGRDVFGGRFTRLAGFLRYGDALSTGAAELRDESFDAERADGSELYVDAGMSSNRTQEDYTNLPGSRVETPRASGAHLGLGARRQVSEHQDLGVAIEADDVRGHSLVSVRALDYRYRFGSPLAVDCFIGASRYSLQTPAFGWYVGAGPQWRDLLPGWDLELTYRYGVKISRVRSLPWEPQAGSPPNPIYRPDAFYNVFLWTLGVSRKF